MILVVDNYDSFTWNLVHYLRELGAELAQIVDDVPGEAVVIVDDQDHGAPVAGLAAAIKRPACRRSDRWRGPGRR